MDFEIKGGGDELPYIWNNFLNDKCVFVLDFVSGKSVPQEGFLTIAGKGGKDRRTFRKFNRNAQEQTQRKRKERHTQVLSRTQIKERKKHFHRQQRSKYHKLKNKVYTSYKYAVSFTHNRHLKPSVEVQPYWKTTHQFDYTELGKLMLPLGRVTETVLSKRGILRKYNNNFENVTTTSPVKMKTKEILSKTIFLHPRAVRDPVLLEYCRKKEGNVFATSRVLALLMSSCRAVQSFDIPLRKKNGVIFLDHRPSSRVMEVSTNETALRRPTVAEKDRRRHNSAYTLKKERTKLNKAFGEQILLPKDQHVSFGQKSPFLLKSGFQKKKSLSDKGYIYKKFGLGQKIQIVCRCEVDGIVGDKVTSREVSSGKGNRGSVKSDFYNYAINRAVHEFQTIKEGKWEDLLESSPGTVIVKELSNNSFEFGRWIFEGLLANASEFQVGFITRKNINSEKGGHELLKIERYDTISIAEQFHVNLSNGYAILEHMLSSIMELEDGEYVLLKIPNKQCVNCYRADKRDEVLQEKDGDEDNEEEEE